jgi:HEAT repeat protein
MRRVLRLLDRGSGARAPGRAAPILAILWSVVLWGAPAAAQMTGNVDKLKADLHGDNVDRAVAAASALGSLKDSQALDALMGALQLGAPPRLTVALLEAVELQKSPKAVDLLRHFATNRRQEIRAAALKALGAIEEGKVSSVLIRAIGDSSPMVRALAARLLGERKERKAERALFKMLRRGDKSAAVPLGTIGGVETAKQLAELINDLPDAHIAATLGTMLRRSDFGPDPLRTEVVKTLGKIPGADATAALVEYIASVPQKEVRLSKITAEKMLEGRQR